MASPLVVRAAMATADGAWRIEVVQSCNSQWFRMAGGDTVIDWLDITDVQRILQAVGVSMADLVEADAAA